MKKITVLVLLLSAITVFSQENKSSNSIIPRKMTAEEYERMLVATGGIVQTPIRGPVLKYINLQNRISLERITETVVQIDRIFHLPYMIEVGRGDYQTAAGESLKGTNCALVVIVADVAEQPSLLLAPGSRWVLVNVWALAADKPNEEKLCKRVQKELWRAFSYSLGAPNSMSSMCLLRPVVGLEGIDSLKGQTICPEPLNKILQTAKDMGMNPVRSIPYKKACEEGWALAPTNHYQKAIWDEVKTRKAANQKPSPAK